MAAFVNGVLIVVSLNRGQLSLTSEVWKLRVKGKPRIPFQCCYGSKNLREVEIENGEGDPEGYIEDMAFTDCGNLRSISFPPDLDFYIGRYAFSGCHSLTTICLPPGLKKIEIGTFRGCSSLSSITIGEGVIEIGNEAFMNCVSLVDVKLPSGLTII